MFEKLHNFFQKMLVFLVNLDLEAHKLPQMQADLVNSNRDRSPTP